MKIRNLAQYIFSVRAEVDVAPECWTYFGMNAQEKQFRIEGGAGENSDSSSRIRLALYCRLSSRAGETRPEDLGFGLNQVF